MPINANGQWVPNLFSKQFEIFNAFHRYLLVAGPRKSGKTMGVLHKLVRHMWETGGYENNDPNGKRYPPARMAFFSKTKKTAKEGGAWNDLLEFTLPEWFDSDIGVHFTTKDASGKEGVKVESDTKTPYFRINNYWGQEAECRLFSLDNDNEVESKLKQTRYSGIYFAELSNFEDQTVFTTSILQLRMIGLPRSQHMWFADTNPAEDGEDSWIYKYWYRDRIKENHPNPLFQKELELIEIFCEDNPYFTEDDRQELMASCDYDDDVYQRYVKGLWVKGGTKKRHFAGIFRSNIHVVGDQSHADPNEWEVALPSENCAELITSWDPGDTNHAAVIMEKVSGNPFYFVVLDELVFNDERVTLEEFTLEFMAKMNRLEESVGHPVHWKHYADESVINRWRASSGAIDQMVILKASGDKVFLEGCPKEPNSIEKQLIMIKRFLMRRQLFASANCTQTIKMFNELRRPPKTGDAVAKHDPLKHVLDALRYGLVMESYGELRDTTSPRSGRIIVTR